jgi:hypothetical protein
VREHAEQKQIDEEASLSVGMKEKAEEFVAAGAEIIRHWRVIRHEVWARGARRIQAKEADARRAFHAE